MGASLGLTDAADRVERASAPSRLWSWVTAGGDYAPDAGDLQAIGFLGLRVPGRATVAVLVVAGLLLLDYHGRLDELIAISMGPFGSSAPDLQRVRSLARLVLEGLVPLGIVLLVFRDRPARYGIRLGDWRAGLAIGVAGCALMTPLILVLGGTPAFAGYYGPLATSPADVILSSALEVVPAEFFFRGFLLFALFRVAGPVAVIIATLPFAFVHLGKPEIETLSTLAGGIAYGWLDWRTGSVLWSGLAHTWILSLAIIVAGVASGAAG